MKTICGVVVLCVLILCAKTSEATRVERSLKFFLDDKPIDAYSFAASSCESVNSNCRSEVAVSSEVSSYAFEYISYGCFRPISKRFTKSQRKLMLLLTKRGVVEMQRQLPSFSLTRAPLLTRSLSILM